MITTTSRIEDKKPSELILPPTDILDIVICVKDAPYITYVLVPSSDIMRLSAHKIAKYGRPQESILRDKFAFVRISTLETTLEDIQVSSESSSI
ncbi:hypothetical protein Tco_1192765 [Tanacetum coccineum]